MNFDNEIYKAMAQAIGYDRSLMKVTLYCSTTDEATRHFRASQMVKHALLLQDGTFKVHLAEYLDPQISEAGELYGNTSVYLHNVIDIDRLRSRSQKVDKVG